MQAAQTDTEMEDPKPKPISAKAPATKTKGSIPSKVVENGKPLQNSRPAQEKVATATTPASKSRGRPKKAQEETPAPSIEVRAPKTRPAGKKRKLNAD